MLHKTQVQVDQRSKSDTLNLIKEKVGIALNQLAQETGSWIEHYDHRRDLQLINGTLGKAKNIAVG